MFSRTVPENRNALLRHDAELAPQRPRAQLPQVVPIDEQPASLRVIEARHQLRQRRLPGPRLADERHGLARGYVEVDPVQRPVLLAVGERDVVQLDLTPQPPGVERIRLVDHVGLRLEQIEDLVQRRHSLLVGGVELGDLLNRVEERVQVADECDQDADLDVALDRLVAAVQEDHARADRRQQLDRREVGGVEVDRGQVGGPVLLVEHRHPRQVARLLREAPHHPHARERLLEIGGDVGDLLPRQSVGARRSDPKGEAGGGEQREGHEGHQRELRVEQQQDHDHPQ